ncbi:NAD(P)-dependent oxidoreductase [Zwartia sp.]|uniref:NAD(P)-dependent oxidoreductase n=1 Tax=Zwartia sp. TaxID=2978004 RepID=UPI00271DE696|nr:NAD(P)-dependent oxidoreductase [Zwartia sp.]MDO9025951.1 NAD(P)-dependent oxidoreductase [Zwartia sp.]
MKLGLIGLGNMGVHFGTRLLAAGYELMVFDINPAMIKRLQDKGATVAQSARAIGDACEVVLLCLPMPAAVAEVATGSEGVMHGSAVKVIIDLSTTGPSVTGEVAAAVQAKGIDFLGAPVSGGTVAAEKGTLTLMISGRESLVQEMDPIFKTLGKNLFYLGADPTLGQTMKLVNNTLCAVGMVASCEALVYGAKAGLDSKLMLDVLNVSSGRSFATLEKIPQCVLNREFPTRFTTELIHKDIKLCIEEAEKIGAPMLVSQAARTFLAFAITQGDGKKDYAHTIKHFEGWAGVEFGQAKE